MSDDRILLAHGAGGRQSERLVAERFIPHLGNGALDELMDSAVLGELALTTDAYVVSPWQFPGGDIGRLAVCGTVNDLCMVGARPFGLTAAFILEEGLGFDVVDTVAASMAAAAAEAGVHVVAGDTKVVPRGACDKLFITTAGVGHLDDDFRPAPTRVQPGDHIIVSGTIADHGIAVMAVREGIPLRGELRSDTAPLGALVQGLRQAAIDVRALRDPTRGGVAQSLHEIARAAGVRIRLDETKLPIRPTVGAGCELLGIDPLYVANEGKLLAFVPAAQSEAAVASLRAHPLGRDAAMIGEVVAGRPGCELRTRMGGTRTVRPPQGELLPRIC